jgi:hypothetical protein
VIDRHIADLAELYALGALDEMERAAVDAHLRDCPSCAAFVASAERDVALIASMESRHRAPPELQRRIERLIDSGALPPVPETRRRAWAPVAIAAALVIGLLPSAYLWSANRAMHDEMLAQNAAIARLASAHRTATFRSMPGGPPADVSYGMDGSWYVVVVRGNPKPFGVVWMHGAQRTMLGMAVPRGNMAMLYLPKSHRMDRLALMDGDRIVAQASLSWQRTAPNRQAARFG